MAEKVGIERCESPLEIALAEAFARQMRWSWRVDGAHAWEVGRWSSWWLVLLAQPKLAPYRPDFAITSTWNDSDPSMFVTVEVDGHEYHERTKEQAQRDKARDRFFTARDVRVFRFTGSEVYRDSDACACEVLSYVVGVQEKAICERFVDYVKAKEAEAERP